MLTNVSLVTLCAATTSSTRRLWLAQSLLANQNRLLRESKHYPLIENQGFNGAMDLLLLHLPPPTFDFLLFPIPKPGRWILWPYNKLVGPNDSNDESISNESYI